MIPADDAPFNLAELCRRAGVTPRTVRYYIAEGLLPPPVGAGPGAAYRRAHLDRLRLVRRLQQSRLPLNDIRARLAGLDDGQVAALLAAEPSAPPASAAEYVRAVLGGGLDPVVRATEVGMPLDQWTPEARRVAEAPESAYRSGGASLLAGAPIPPPAQAIATPPPDSSGPVGATGRLAASLFRRSSTSSPGPVRSASAGLVGATRPAPLRTALPADEAPVAPAATTTWERLNLADGVELHVRSPLTHDAQTLVDRLAATARQFLEEKQP